MRKRKPRPNEIAPDAPRIVNALLARGVLKTSELAGVLGCETATIFQQLYRGICPLVPVRIRVGKRVHLRWRREDVEKLLAGEIVLSAPVADRTAQ
ncbi:MAG: hypothetical protein ACKVX7_12580 [Planctomycetota bacterium]